MKRFFLVAATALFAVGPAFSQESEVESLRRQLAEERARLDELSAEVDRLSGEGAGAEDPLAGEGGEAPPQPTTDPGEEAPEDPAVPEWLSEIKLGMFYVESADGFFKLAIKGRLMADGRFLADHGHPDFDNHFQIRRGRIEFVGHLHERVEYSLGLEFGRTSDADFRNAWVDVRFHDALRLRAGQMLLPYSDLRLNSSKYLNHPERTALVASIVGNRDIGVMLHGSVADGLVNYYVGAFGGEGQNKRVDTDDDFDLAVRTEVLPLRSWGLAFTANYIYTPTNRGNSGPGDLRTVGNQFSLFADFDGTNNVSNGRRHRFGGGFKFSTGPFEAKGEINGDYHEEVLNTASGFEENLLNWSYHLDLSYVLTGEELKQKFDGSQVQPKAPLYDPETKEYGLGAFQLSVRFEDLYLDDRTLDRGFAVGTDQVRAVTSTLHWYMWKNVRFSLSYTYSHFQDGVYDSAGNRHVDDHGILGRLAFWF